MQDHSLNHYQPILLVQISFYVRFSQLSKRALKLYNIPPFIFLPLLGEATQNFGGKNYLCFDWDIYYERTRRSNDLTELIPSSFSCMKESHLKKKQQPEN